MEPPDNALKRAAHRESLTGSRPGEHPLWVGEDVVGVRFPLRMDESATAANASRMRRSFASWLDTDVAAGELAEDLALGVYEALANVVDHAYAATPDHLGAVRLTAHRAHMILRITVSDDGRWRDGHEAPFRNRGLEMIRVLIAQVHIDTSDSGTTVHLRCALPVPAESATT